MAPRAPHSAPPPSSISVFSPLIFHSRSLSFFPFFPLPSFFIQLPLLFSSSAKHPLHIFPTFFSPNVLLSFSLAGFRSRAYDCWSHFVYHVGPSTRQLHPPVAAARVYFGVFRVSCRSSVSSLPPPHPACEVSLSGLRPRNEERREGRRPRGWARTQYSSGLTQHISVWLRHSS